MQSLAATTTKAIRTPRKRDMLELDRSPYLRLLNALAANMNLPSVVGRMDLADVREMVSWIEGMDDRLSDFLADLNLPQTEDRGFWRGQVLPLLQRRIRQTERPAPAYVGSDIFAKVKSAVAVEDLAMRYTDLKPAGSGKLKGRCPLHHERTASFYVYSDSNRWRCYGRCAEGGDVIYLAQRLMDGGIL